MYKKMDIDKSDTENKLKFLAQAIYEIRLLLSHHVGSNDEDNICEAVSANFAYALHNDALAIIDGKPKDFDMDKALERIKLLDERYGAELTEKFEYYIKK